MDDENMVCDLEGERKMRPDAPSQKLVYTVARALTDFHKKPPGDLDLWDTDPFDPVVSFKGFTIEDFLADGPPA